MKSWIWNSVRAYVDVRAGEGKLTALIFAYYLLVLFAYYILKPVARALFLDSFDADKLPWLYILMAVLGGSGASWISRAAARSRLTQVIGKTQVFLIGNILLLWWLLQYPSKALLYAFSIWVGTFSVVTVGQFWLLANNLFDSRQARRLFPLIGLAAVLGAVAGGTLTNLVVRAVGARGLLLVCGALMAGTWVVVRGLRPYERAVPSSAEPEKEYRTLDTFRLVWDSKHLRTISFLVAVIFVVDTLVDYQFSVMAKQTFQGPQLTAFLARFWGIYLSLASVVLQLFFAGPVLKRLGVGGALAAAPVSVTAGCAAFLMFPSLMAAGFTRLIEASTRYTTTRFASELLYLPISREVKNRTKIFMETFVDRVSRASAGGILLLCTSVVVLSLRGITVLTLVFAAAWIVLVGLVLRSYVRTLRKAIEKHQVHFENVRINVADAATLAVLTRALDSSNDRQIAYALRLLEHVPEVSLADRLPSLLRHSSPEVRAATLGLLAARGDYSAIQQAQEFMFSGTPEVRAQAVHYVCQSGADPRAQLQDLLNHPDLAVRLAALSAAEEHSYPRPLAAISREWIEDLLGRTSDQGATARTVAAQALPLADPQRIRVVEALRVLLGDSDSAVVNAAMKAAGKIQIREVVPLLVSRLGARATRAAAREALARFGPRLVGTLGDYLNDPKEPDAVRRAIPRLLSQIGTGEAAAILIRALPQSDFETRFQILRALNRLRRDHPEAKVPSECVDREILREAQRYYQLLLSVQSAPASDTPGGELLNRSLGERLEQTLERIFRLLGLGYPPEEVYDAYRAVQSPHADRRAAALEFLDNTLDRPLKRMLLPVLEGGSPDRLLPLAQELFGLQPLETEQGLRALIRGDDPWLKMLALYRAAELPVNSLEAEIRAAAADPDPRIAETAALALRRLLRPAA